jgi:hypothetical protein
MKALRLHAALAGIERAEFELGGLLKFHCVSLCSRPYPLPRRTSFRIRNPIHLIETRNSVTYVRGIFQRLLALLRERELGCGHPITSRLSQLSHYFSPSGGPSRTGGPGIVLTFDRGRFSSSGPRGLLDVLFRSGFGNARLIHFPLDASECRLVGFLLWFVLMHICTTLRRDYWSMWTRLAVSALFLHRAVFANLQNVASQTQSCLRA